MNDGNTLIFIPFFLQDKIFKIKIQNFDIEKNALRSPISCVS